MPPLFLPPPSRLPSLLSFALLSLALLLLPAPAPADPPPAPPTDPIPLAYHFQTPTTPDRAFLDLPLPPPTGISPHPSSHHPPSRRHPHPRRRPPTRPHRPPPLRRRLVLRRDPLSPHLPPPPSPERLHPRRPPRPRRPRHRSPPLPLEPRPRQRHPRHPLRHPRPARPHRHPPLHRRNRPRRSRLRRRHGPAPFRHPRPRRPPPRHHPRHRPLRRRPLPVPPPLPPLRPDPHPASPETATAITDLLKTLATALRRANPDLVLSAAVYPTPQTAASRNQDWPSWLSENLLDHVSPMIYANDLPTFQTALSSCLAAAPANKLLPGVAVVADEAQPTPASFASQLRHLSTLHLLGAAYFPLSPALPSLLQGL